MTYSSVFHNSKTIPAQGLRYYLMNAGYKLGSGFLAKIQQNGLMAKLTYAASVLGLMVVGGMTAENVSISFPLKFGSGNEATTLNDVFNHFHFLFLHLF